MIRTPKLVWVLAATLAVLFGIGLVQYANSGPQSAPIATPSAQHQLSNRLPADPPAAAVQPAAAPAPPAAAAPAAPPTPAPVASAPAVPQSDPTTLTYVVRPHDTLWDLAATHLGNPLRWTQLYDLNRGRVEPGGTALVNPNLIYPGWTLVFPTDASGLGSPTATTGGLST